jgi:hypothetical protein
MKAVSRLLLLAGAGGIVVATLLPWVTVAGISLQLDLGLIGAEVSPGGRTVSGTETSLWPVLAVVAAVVTILTALRIARRILLALGLLTMVGGGGLVYYTQHVIDIESSKHGALAQALAHAVLTSSTDAGPPLLLASGAAIALGALAA